ncbi:histidine kinase [Nocardiopsis gilva]|uniref:sensor histidine kinase n=2 Tax=Nocardiopsis gilva TaxID=280236 RepID=UPI001E51FB24|nr:histidine kinase [Nocardiopsis gilva]
MTLLLRRYALLDRRILGGRLYLGSTLWAGMHFGVGLLLWGLAAYVERPDIDQRWLLLTLTGVCAAVLLRRSAPGTGLAIASLFLLADIALGPSWWVLVVYGEALYAVAVWGRRRLAYGIFTAVMTCTVVAIGVLVYLLAHGVLESLLEVVQFVGLFVLVFVTPMMSGLTVREHHLRAELERQRADQLLRMAELDRGTAIAEERGRMARELHDVIANHLSAIAVQSTAALSMRDPDPERVRQILGVVRDNSVRGLAEMRQMIGVLRADDNPDLERVTPRLSEADRLVDTARESGLDVRMEERGTAPPLPARVDAAAYRIVQESLTNALRYAEPRRVDITVEYTASAPGQEADRLVLTAENPAPVRPEPTWRVELGGGAGVTGMRERVALLGGHFEAGPSADEDAGWRVRAELPIAQPGVPEDTDGQRAGMGA